MIVKNLSKTYKLKNSPAVQALNDISFTLADTGMVFFLGKSGSGKSTLLNVLSGLDKADEGSHVEIYGKDICALSISELDDYRNSCCGFVFQEYNLIPELNVQENIALAIELQGENDIEDKVKDALKKVELDGYEKRKVTELSGGQKQRIAIARALIKNPDIIFADEPTGALDKGTGESIMELLKELSKEKLVVVVSHDNDYAARYADRIIELEDGKIINDSTASTTTSPTESTSSKEWHKSHLPIKSALKIGCGNFKRHPVRIIATLLLSILTFSLLGISINIAMMNPYQSFIDAAYDKNLEYTALYKFNAAQYEDYNSFDQLLGSNNITYKQRCLSEYDLSLLRDRYDMEFSLICSAYIKSFYKSIAATVKQLNEALHSSNDHNSIHADGFMAMSLSECNRHGFEIIGRLPENDNEIAINECMLNSFMVAGIIEDAKTYPINSAEDILGHKISVSMDVRPADIPIPNQGKFGDSDIKTIVGVVDTGCDRQCSKTHPEEDYVFNPENYHEKIFISENFFNEWSYILCDISPNKNDFRSFANFVFDYNDNDDVFMFSNQLMGNRYIDTNSFYYSLDAINMEKNLYLYISIVLLIISFVFMINFIATSISS
ncbi:MAG: ABC transporter ATP-binding protein, partial [Clostridiales bacterium]|nr:ABC transporter ATP-binding protein [Clostridiales bacterium]